MKKLLILFFITSIFNYSLFANEANKQIGELPKIQNDKTKDENNVKNDTTNKQKKTENNKITNNLIGTENNKNINNKTSEETATPFQDNYYNSFNTFMLTKNNLELIKKALIIYNNNILNLKKMNLIKNEENDEGENFEYDKNIGNVYLKSIMYISKNFWTVWINDKKISNKNNLEEDNEFFIEKINLNEAIIRWTVGKNKWNIINYENNIHMSEYNFNEKTNKIEFRITLHPNQTFVASENKVIDGKYKEPNTINTIISDESIDSIFDDENIDFNLLIK